MRAIGSLFWDDDAVDHLWRAHLVTADEVEEAIFGVPGEEATYRIIRDGEFYVVFGETGGGRLRKMAGEFLEDRRLRIFSARDMDARERRAYRRG